MTTILVTGGAGFVGSNFIRYWLSRHTDDMVVNLDALTYAGNLDNLQDVVKDYSDRYLLVKGNITIYDLVYHVMTTYRPSVVINFAAESDNNRSVRNPSAFYTTNVVGTQTLLEAARQVGIERFHHVSTTEVYGDMELDSTECFTEMSPIRPNSPYAASKAGADLVVRAYYKTFGVPITISHAANNYGPYQLPEKVFPKFTVSALLGRKLTLFENSHYRREWMHVHDHCSAIERIVTRGRIGESYDISGLFETDIETIADTILEVVGRDSSYKTYIPDRPGHDKRCVLDITKIKTELGWTPSYTFEQGARQTIEWYRDHRDWWEAALARIESNAAALAA